MKKKVMLLLSLSFMLGLGAFAQDVAELPVKTIKGISVAMNGADTVAVFGITEAYGNTEDSFKALACVVPKGNTKDEDLEAGVVYSPNTIRPSVSDTTAFVKVFDKNSRVHGVQLIGLHSGITYYYRVYVKSPDGNVAYGKAYASTTLPGSSICPDSHHPHMVDLGLPSGTKWACCNVGASSPEGYGGYYAWGELTEKNVYSWDTYAYGQSAEDCTNIGTDIANSSYDVAHVKMGGTWHMPTTEQQTELLNNCSYEWKTQNGVNGLLVTGTNGAQIFLPTVGYRWGDTFVYASTWGGLWSCTLNAESESRADVLSFNKDGWYWSNADRFYGFSVRAVCP